MRLIFTRHGESEANVQQIISNRDLPHHLTEKGCSQAQALAEMLAERHVLTIYTSTILRAQETAEIVAGRLSLPVYPAAALREFDCGIMEGRSYAEAWTAHQAVEAAWDAGDHDRRIEAGESYNDLKNRFVPFVREFNEQYAATDGDIVLISHGSMLHQMLPLVLSNIDRNFVRQHPLGNCSCVRAVLQQSRLVCEVWAEMPF